MQENKTLTKATYLELINKTHRRSSVAIRFFIITFLLCPLVSSVQMVTSLLLQNKYDEVGMVINIYVMLFFIVSVFFYLRGRSLSGISPLVKKITNDPDSLVWIYLKQTSHSVNFIPTGVTREFILNFDDGSSYSAGLFGYPEVDVRILLSEIAPNALYGYHLAILKLYRQNPKLFLQLAKDEHTKSVDEHKDVSSNS